MVDSEITRKTGCPSPAELEGFDRGLLSEPGLERVAAHLESGCQQCEDFLEGLVVDNDEFTSHLSLAASSLSDSRLPAQVGRYQIESEIGRGGMGIVYRAFDPKARRVVALKRISGSEITKSNAIERFQHETESLGKIDHPNVVSLFDCGIDNGIPFLVFEFIAGSSLEEYTSEQTLLPPRKAAEIIRTVALAIQACHDVEILHRDIKPANILLTANLEPMVTDFGLARALAQSDSNLTHTGTGLGTPKYSSPEQATGQNERVGPASDVYSLGATLYVLLTGRAPFEGSSTLELLDRIKKQNPESPSRIQSNIPRDLETICLKCLEKDPERRYPSPRALSVDLDHFLASRPILARRSGPGTKAWKWCKRNPGYSITSVMIVVLLAGIVWQRIEAYSAWFTIELHEQEDYFYKVRSANFEGSNHRLDTMEQILESCPVNRRNLEWYLLNNNFLHQEVLRIKKEKEIDTICGVQWSPAGTILVVFYGNQVEFWNVAKCENVKSFQIPESDLCLISWENQAMACFVRDSEAVEVKSLEDGSTIRQFMSLNPEVERMFQIALDSNGHWLIGAAVKAVFVWDYQTGDLLNSWSANVQTIRSLRIHPDKPWLCTVYEKLGTLPANDGITIWEIPSGRLLTDFALSEVTGQFGAFEISPDGKWLATGQLSDPRSPENSEIVLWNVETASLSSKIAAHPGPIRSLAFHPYRREILSAGGDSILYLLEYSETGELSPMPARRFPAYGRIESVKFNPSGSQFAVLDEGGVRVWDYSKDYGPFRMGCHPGSGIFSVAISPDGRHIATGGSGGVVKLFNSETGHEVREFIGMETDENYVVFDLKFSPDGKRIAGVGRGIEIQGVLWDVETGQTIAALTSGTNAPDNAHGDILSVAFHPNGRLMVTGGNGGFFRVWDAKDGTLINEFPVAAHKVTELAFSPDGRLGIVGEPEVFGMNSLAAIIDPENGSTQIQFERVFGAAKVAFSTDPEGRWIAFGGPGKDIQVFDSRSGTRQAEMVGHTRGIKSIAFHPNGNRLVSCGDDYTIRIWELESGREIIARHDHPGGVESLCISADGTKMVTGGWGNTTFIWDISPAQIREFQLR